MDRCLQVSGFFSALLDWSFVFEGGEVKGVMVLPECFFFSSEFPTVIIPGGGGDGEAVWQWQNQQTFTRNTNCECWMGGGENWIAECGRGCGEVKSFSKHTVDEKLFVVCFTVSREGESVCLLLGRLLTFRFWVMNKIWSPRARLVGAFVCANNKWKWKDNRKALKKQHFFRSGSGFVFSRETKLGLLWLNLTLTYSDKINESTLKKTKFPKPDYAEFTRGDPTWHPSVRVIIMLPRVTAWNF